MGEVSFTVICNSDFDLEKIDFTSIGVCVFKNLSEGHKKYIEDNSVDGLAGLNLAVFESLEEENHTHEDYYVIIPIDLADEKYQDKILDCFHFLLICKPSNLHVLYECFFDLIEGKLSRTFFRTHSKRLSDQYPGHNFDLSEDKLEEVDKFMKKYIENKDIGYIEVSIQSYISSFDMNYYSMQFISLLMSIESLVNGSNELSYRLKRIVAIICGKDTDTSKNIFDNINKVYKIRSKLIHGEKYEIDDIHTCIPYLIYLSSRVLIELITLGFGNRENLDSKITFLGFGQKNVIRDDYEEVIIDDFTYNTALNHKL